MILVVDDTPENLFSLQKILAHEGLEADTASSGEEALRKVLHTDYELIILDVQMPEMDGFEVAEMLAGHSRTRDIPVLFLSAIKIEKRFVSQGYKSGALDYLVKPVDPDIFLLKVKNFCRLHRQTVALKTLSAELEHEVSTRKEAETALHTHIHTLSSLLSAMPQIAFTASPAGNVEYANEQWQEYARAGNEWIVTKGDRHDLRALTLQAKAQQPVLAEVELQHPQNGTTRYHLLRVVALLQGDKVVRYIGTLTDIHEQKSSEYLLEQMVKDRTQELLQSNRALEARNDDLQQFASVASHDLKEPLRKIQIFSNIILEKHKSNTEPELANYIERIHSSSQRMSALINDLLDFSRLSGNNVFVHTDLTVLMQEIISDLEVQISECGATVTITTLPYAEVVPGQISQLFQNLLSNAIKFARPGVPPVIRISGAAVPDPDIADGESNWCSITIADNGIGFDKQYKEKIFSMFQRLNNASSYQGTGIGLAIARKIVQKHNGFISADSIEGEGTTFTILIPCRQPKTEQDM